jgi:hypothetical protein
LVKGKDMEISESTLIKLAEGQGRIEQKIDGLSARMFGGDGQEGVLPIMFKQHETLTDRVTVLEKSAIRSKGWIAGAVAVLTTVGSIFGALITWVVSLHHVAQVAKR